MRGLHKRYIISAFIVLLVILFAAWLRWSAGANIDYSATPNNIRSIIYICLMSAWGISVRARIVQVQARRYLTGMAALIVLWLVLRSLKFGIFFNENVDVCRYLWYGYYISMIYMPLMAVLVAMSLGKSENYRLPRWTGALYIVAGLILLMVLTNDLHRFVFIFPNNVMSDRDYSYGPGYYITATWCAVCAISAFAIILIKCRVPHSRKYMFLPVVPFLLLFVYCYAYALNVHWLRVVAGDMTVAICLITAGILESCIWCGLIQSNAGYEDIFESTTIKTQITDNEFNTIYASPGASVKDTEKLSSAVDHPIRLDENTLLKGFNLKNGFVFWQEDISELTAVTKQLELTHDELRETGDIIKAENDQKKKWLQITEENRLYDAIEMQTSKQIYMLNSLISKLKQTEDTTEARKLLGKIAIIGAYIKRRSNLIFVETQRKNVAAGELQLCLDESAANLKLLGIECKAFLDINELMSPKIANLVYDLFEAVVEKSFETAKSLLLFCGVEGDLAEINISVACGDDLSNLCIDYPSLTAEQDEDGLWCLSLKCTSDGDCI